MKTSFRSILTIAVLFVFQSALLAQDTMYVARKTGDWIKIPVNDIDSIFFQQPDSFPQAALKITTTNLGGNDYALSAGNYGIKIDGDAAGRISSLTYNGQEFLSGSNVSSNWGATHWSSPQSEWGWPPPDAFDNDPATMSKSDSTLTAELAVDNDATGLQFSKLIGFDLDREAFTLTVTITNTNPSSYSMAPWLITRVPTGGISFFPVNNGLIEVPAWDYTISNDIFWLDYTGSGAEPSGKMIADGAEGWMAHVAGDLVFIHEFPDVDNLDLAPGEGDAEIYVAGGKTYVEIEPQGAYVSIPAGQSITWTVDWIIREIPGDIDASSGSSELVDFVRDIVD